MDTNKRIPYAVWKVDGKELKLKLTTASIIKLEDKLGTNLINIMNNLGTGAEAMPSLKVMLLITHQALQCYEHGYAERDVVELFDKYQEEGGSQIGFMTEVFIPIYQASGFFSGSQAKMITENLEEAESQL